METTLYKLTLKKFTQSSRVHTASLMQNDDIHIQTQFISLVSPYAVITFVIEGLPKNVGSLMLALGGAIEDSQPLQTQYRRST